MALPKAVQEQEALADQLVEQINNPQPEPVVEPKQEEAPQLQVVQTQPAENWEHKFSSLKGKYDSEVPGLYNQLAAARMRESELAVALQQRDQVISQLRSQPQQHQAFEVPLPAEFAKASEAEVQLIGEDTVNYVRRAVNEAVEATEAKYKPLEQEVIQLRGRLVDVTEKQALTAEQQFFRDVGIAHPDWQQVNNDPKFHEWLAVVVPETGRTRFEHMKEARDSLNTPRIIEIFSMAKQALKPAEPETPKPTGQQQLAKHVAPDTTAPVVETPTDVGYITESEVNSFYLAVAKGHYNGKEKERMAMEQKIDDAAATGRIRPG